VRPKSDSRDGHDSAGTPLQGTSASSLDTSGEAAHPSDVSVFVRAIKLEKAVDPAGGEALALHVGVGGLVHGIHYRVAVVFRRGEEVVLESERVVVGTDGATLLFGCNQSVSDARHRVDVRVHDASSDVLLAASVSRSLEGSGVQS